MSRATCSLVRRGPVGRCASVNRWRRRWTTVRRGSRRRSPHQPSADDSVLTTRSVAVRQSCSGSSRGSFPPTSPSYERFACSGRRGRTWKCSVWSPCRLSSVWRSPACCGRGRSRRNRRQLRTWSMVGRRWRVSGRSQPTKRHRVAVAPEGHLRAVERCPFGTTATRWIAASMWWKPRQPLRGSDRSDTVTRGRCARDPWAAGRPSGPPVASLQRSSSFSPRLRGRSRRWEPWTHYPRSGSSSGFMLKCS